MGGDGVSSGRDRGAGEAWILVAVKVDSWLSTAAQLDDECGLPAKEEPIEFCGEGLRVEWVVVFEGSLTALEEAPGVDVDGVLSEDDESKVRELVAVKGNGAGVARGRIW